MKFVDKIRYKYRTEKFGTRLDAVVCPVCGNPINWTKPTESYEWAHKTTLLAECWSGDTHEDKPRHLFLIHIDEGILPTVEISKTKSSSTKIRNKKWEG